MWKPRKRHRGNDIGRMYSSSPLECARFCIRLLLTAVSGRKSYECARRLPEGTECETPNKLPEKRKRRAASYAMIGGISYFPRLHRPRKLKRCRGSSPPFLHTVLQGRRAQCEFRPTPIFQKVGGMTLFRTMPYSSKKTYAPHGRRFRHSQPSRR